MIRRNGLFEGTGEKIEFDETTRKWFGITRFNLEYYNVTEESALKHCRPRWFIDDNYPGTTINPVSGSSEFGNRKYDHPNLSVYVDNADYIGKELSDEKREGTEIEIDDVNGIVNAIPKPKNEEDCVIFVEETYKHYVDVKYVPVEKLDESVDWDNIKDGDFIKDFGNVFFDIESAVRFAMKQYELHLGWVLDKWEEVKVKLHEYYSAKEGIRSKIRNRRGITPKVEEPSDEDWWNSLSSEEKANMLKKMRSQGR